MSIGARVATCRLGKGSATAFLSYELGNVANDEFTPVLKINDVVLRQRDDGEYWLAFPSKQRMRDGQPVLNDAGRPVYDDFVTPAFEQTNTGWKVSKAGERFKAYLLKLALEALDGIERESAGRGSASRAAAPAAAPARRAPAAAGTARKRVAEPVESNLGFGGEDDDLPF